MNINKENLKEFTKHMKQAAKEFGVDLEIGTIRFSNNTAKFSANIYAEGGKQNEFEKAARKFGFSSGWYGRTFMDDKSVSHTIIGANMRARTRPIITRSDGKEFTWTVSGVLSCTED